MPEGDTIYRSAQRLRTILQDAAVIEARDNGRFVDLSQLVGSKFMGIEAKGKHLLMHLDDGRLRARA